jgi:uncharacterized protein with HEPN domain
MSRRDDRETRLEMLRHAREILELTRGRTQADLENERTLELSLLHLFALIGEIATRVSSAARDAHPEIPWRQITGMRNWVIHAYDRVELETVWQAVAEDVPPLVAHLERIVR